MKASKLLTKEQRKKEYGQYILFKKQLNISFEDWLINTYKI